MNIETTDDPTEPATEFRVLSGRKAVLSVLAFGVVMVAALWLYWDFYTRPFRPFQEAINAEFPGSSPRVVGGRHKSHRDGSPKRLRIVIHVDFDPNTADEPTTARHVSRLRELAAAHLDLSSYEVLEIHLVNRVPEGETLQRSFEFPLSDE